MTPRLRRSTPWRGWVGLARGGVGGTRGAIVVARGFVGSARGALGGARGWACLARGRGDEPRAAVMLTHAAGELPRADFGGGAQRDIKRLGLAPTEPRPLADLHPPRDVPNGTPLGQLKHRPLLSRIELHGLHMRGRTGCSIAFPFFRTFLTSASPAGSAHCVMPALTGVFEQSNASSKPPVPFESRFMSDLLRNVPPHPLPASRP
jgi:hypothetical protein